MESIEELLAKARQKRVTPQWDDGRKRFGQRIGGQPTYFFYLVGV